MSATALLSPHARAVRALAIMFGLAALLLLAGCTGFRGGPVPYDVKDFGPPDAPSSVALEQDYRIAPLDTLRVSVFQVPDLSGEFEVDLIGNVSMPLVGDVRAIDLTTAQLDTLLTERLGQKYLQNPDVTVGIKSSTRRSVTLDGAVQAPGIYPITGSTTLIQAIAMGRGESDTSNPKRVAIFRQIEGKRMAAAFDLVSIRRGKGDDPKIYPGDIIVVDGSNIKRAQREVLQNLPIVGFFLPFL